MLQARATMQVAIPQAQAMHVATPLPTMPSLPNDSAARATPGNSLSSQQLFEVQEAASADEMPVGIHLAEEALRLAGWDSSTGEVCALPADSESADGSLRACACYVRPGQVLLGDDIDPKWREQPQHTLLRPVRLLGRSFSSLGGARWLADEDAHTPCQLAPDGEASYSAGRARFRLVHERAPSDARRRASTAAAKGGGGKKVATTIETDVAPEEAVQKLLRRAIGSVAAKCGGAEPTHAVLAVGAGSNLAARQAAADAAVMAGLEVLAVVTETAAILAEPGTQTALNAHCGAGAAALVLVWGTGSFAASVAVDAGTPAGSEGPGARCWRISATASDVEMGLTALDRSIGSLLLRQLEDDDDVSGSLASPYNKISLQLAAAALRSEVMLGQGSSREAAEGDAGSSRVVHEAQLALDDGTVKSFQLSLDADQLDLLLDQFRDRVAGLATQVLGKAGVRPEAVGAVLSASLVPEDELCDSLGAQGLASALCPGATFLRVGVDAVARGAAALAASHTRQPGTDGGELAAWAPPVEPLRCAVALERLGEAPIQLLPAGTVAPCLVEVCLPTSKVEQWLELFEDAAGDGRGIAHGVPLLCARVDASTKGNRKAKARAVSRRLLVSFGANGLIDVEVPPVVLEEAEAPSRGWVGGLLLLMLIASSLIALASSAATLRPSVPAADGTGEDGAASGR